MKKAIYFFFGLFMVFILFGGCATNYKLISYDYSNHDIDKIYQEGNEYTLLATEDIGISVAAKLHKKIITLYLFYFNFSDHKIDIIPEHIKASCIYYGKKESLKVYSAEEWLKRLRNRQTASLVLSIIGGSSSTTTTGNVGNENVYLKSTTHDYSETRNMARIFEEDYFSTEKRLLKRTTLFPEEYIGGEVKIKYLRADEYIVIIPFEDENFVITFRIPV